MASPLLVVLASLTALSMIAVFLTIAYFSQQIKKREHRIHELTRSLIALRSKLEHTKMRQSYRMTHIEQPCTYELVATEVQMEDISAIRSGEATIKDISRTGARLTTPVDWPVRNGLAMKLHFSLCGDKFSFLAKVVRKEERPRTDAEYGVEFVETSMGEDDSHRFAHTLQKLEFEKRGRSERI